MNSENSSEETREGLHIRESIKTFYDESTAENLLSVMNLLAESLIWISCNIDEEAHLTPNVLRNDNEYYLPVFTSPEEMENGREKYSKIQQPFTEAIALARDCKTRRLSGIVVDAFTMPFTLSWDLLNMITVSEDS